MTKIYKCFPQGKFKVLTMSYDDGKLADKRLVTLFNQYGLKGTFHLNSGLTTDRLPLSEYATLYKGHEIACHTATHPTISRCPMEQVTLEILDDRKALEQLTGQMVRGLSYPNGSYNEAIKSLLPHLGIAYSRIVGDSESFNLPNDFYEWLPTCHHNHKLQALGEEFINLHKSQYLYMMYVWGHSYEFDRDHNWEVIEAFCQLVGHREDIWYATNIEIVDYLTALDRLQFSANGDFAYNPSAISTWVSVNEQIYEIKPGQQIHF